MGFGSLGKVVKKAISTASGPVGTALFPGIGIPLNVASGGQGLLGGGGVNLPNYDPNGDRAQFDQLANNEFTQRTALGQKQQGQINSFADDQAKRAADYRATLAKSLADTSAATFKSMNPGILEDLNSRGLFTSQTARDQEQGRLLSDLATNQKQQLTAFDNQNYGDQNDTRSQGLNALLGGDQSALDSSLALRKAGLTRQFDTADTAANNSFAAQLAKKQSKDQLLQSLLGLGGQLGSAAILA